MALIGGGEWQKVLEAQTLTIERLTKENIALKNEKELAIAEKTVVETAANGIPGTRQLDPLY
jgi:hypothetical protein